MQGLPDRLKAKRVQTFFLEQMLQRSAHLQSRLGTENPGATSGEPVVDVELQVCLSFLMLPQFNDEATSVPSPKSVWRSIPIRMQPAIRSVVDAPLLHSLQLNSMLYFACCGDM